MSDPFIINALDDLYKKIQAAKEVFKTQPQDEYTRGVINGMMIAEGLLTDQQPVLLESNRETYRKPPRRRFQG